MTKPRFIRLVDGRIETATKTFVKGDTSVVFAGNIHRAPAEYFRSLLELIEPCDRVLYERRGKDGDNLPDALRPYEALFAVWSALSVRPVEPAVRKERLSVRDVINVDRPGWTWCDVWFSEIYEELARLLPHERDREEYLLTIYRRYLRDRFYVPADKARSLRLFTTLFHEDVIGQVLIRLSNERLASGLRDALTEGVKRIGILYGASHGDEIEQLLIEELGFSLHEEAWTTVAD